MSSISHYFAIGDNNGDGINSHSIASDKHPIAINCAGRFATSFPFTTDNPSGRADYYLLYMVRGKMKLSAGNMNATAVSGSVFVIPPHTHYTYTYSGGEPMDYLWAHFTGSYAEGLLSECGITPLPYFGHAKDSARISDGFRRMFESFEIKAPLFERRMAICLEEIILDIAEGTGGESNPRPLDASLRYIHSAYSQHLSIPELAAMENLSNSRYIALFNKHMGMSPTAYIIGLRLNTACELLRTTDMSVKQVGILVGYPDAHFFSKIFKKHKGISPVAYKEQRL